VRVLAVDTTTPRGSAAVVSEGGVEAEVRVVTNDGHSRWLLPAVDAMLRGLGTEAKALDAFAVTVGPGSFTGLRIGLSTVQGLALASGRPCIPLSTLDVLARAATPREGFVVALMDAFRGELYAALFDRCGAPAGVPVVGPLEQALAAAPAEATIVGDVDERLRDRIRALRPAAVFAEVDLFLAARLGRAAVETAPAQWVSAVEIRPLYLRGAGVRVASA
jgi:tRNA threonylcarbamoyladenosine biosynthesis protein TsaB